MLQSVAIKNFRCLRSVSVPLKPLTVLVGPNDSGKSVFLAALRRVANGEHAFALSDHWRSEQAPPPTIIAETSTGRLQVSPGTAKWPGSSTNPSPYAPTTVFQLPSSGVRMESQGQPDDQGAPQIADNGEGIPSLIDYLLRRDRRRFDDLVERLRGLVPGLEGIEVATPKPHIRRLDLVIEKGLRIPADQASAGVRFLVFLVALTYHPRPPKLILIEEPETGIHPKRLVDVMNLLRQVSQGAHGGSAAQVVLTTHSPYLLDLVNLESDQVLVFRRLDDGSRTAEPADQSRLKSFLDEFLLGEVWYNEGEPGLVSRKG